MKEYKCECCKFATICKSNYNTHCKSKKHEALSNGLPYPTRKLYKCEKCEYSTYRCNNFKTHQMKHEVPMVESKIVAKIKMLKSKLAKIDKLQETEEIKNLKRDLSNELTRFLIIYRNKFNPSSEENASESD